MDPLQELVLNLQELAKHTPELVKPLLVAPSAAIPLIEGEMGAVIGMVGGMHPVVAGISTVGFWLTLTYVLGV